ncbi:MAG: enterochelin esterase [Myxococcales bacterium]|nr:enterochelin esterase [Myxococcales bacterium]
MSLAIHSLLRTRPLDQGAVERFLRDHEFPLVEGTSATFVFRGEVDAVFLRHWVFGLGSQQPFHRLPGTDLWYLVIELPRGSRVEYKLEVHRGGHSTWIRDPRNQHLAHDPFGANSVCQGEGYATPEWVHPDHEARPGTLEEVVLPKTPFGDARRLTIYLPARFRVSRRYRLLVVHDGGDYLRFSALKTVLDNLIHRLEVAPLIVALTHPHDRLIEYANDPTHADYIVNTVLPYMEERFPLFPAATARCLMGASFGGVASLSTAWRYPGRFGCLLLQSGSFAFTDIGENRRGPAFDRVVSFVNAFREAPGRPAEKVFVSCGTYESLIYENRSMVPLLQTTGMDIRYEEARDGHNWENWRDRLRIALSWIFPGPLWMVYE